MQPQNLFRNHKCLCSLGILLLFVGITLLAFNSTLFNFILNKELVLTPEKETYKVWRKTPMPITLDFYFFNWTNPEDVKNTSIKPRLVEMGPYVFREIKEKVNIVWHSNGTVTYKQLRKWYFDEEKSNGNLSDMVTTLDPIGVTAATKSKYLSIFMKTGLSVLLPKHIHTTKSVGEFLFDGYNDNLIDMAKNMPKLSGVEMPPFDKFGWFYKRNGSTEFDGVMTMGTGTHGVPLGSANLWNYNSFTDFYEGECGKVYGSAGELWPQYIRKNEIFLFIPDTCRTISLQFDKEDTVKDIIGYKFIGGKKTMDNGTLYPENQCYCGGECVPSGVLNVTSCRFGAPGFISYPHFYAADPFYVNQFEGLEPEKEKHEMHVTLEPRTGIPLSVSAKFQVNLLMTSVSHITLYSDAPRLFFPMLWFRQDVEIPDELAGGLKQLINLPGTINIFAIITTVLGSLILIILLSIYTYRKYRTIKLHRRSKIARFTKENVPLNENNQHC